MGHGQNLGLLVSLAEIVEAPGPREQAHALRCSSPLPSVKITLPPLQFGARFAEHWPIYDFPPGWWRHMAYESATPRRIEIQDALLHSSAGIACYADRVIAESCEHTSPERHGFARAGGSVLIDTADAAVLEGTSISLLFGASANYFHVLLDCIARLVALPEEVLRSADRILVPAEAPVAGALLTLVPNVPSVHAVNTRQTLRIPRLILPIWRQDGLNFHPDTMRVFTTILARIAPIPNLPSRIYIDRRGSQRRRLVNEEELIGAMQRRGFTVVQLERLSLPVQMALFREAEVIIAPHGAGLANLVYARPGAALLELHMDRYINWAFRHLAALMNVRYDCVLGRALEEWPPPGVAVHGLSWSIAVPVVLEALEAIMV